MLTVTTTHTFTRIYEHSEHIDTKDPLRKEQPLGGRGFSCGGCGFACGGRDFACGGRCLIAKEHLNAKCYDYTHAIGLHAYYKNTVNTLT